MSGIAPMTVAAIGDAEHPSTWSGIPYHFLENARALGLVAHGLRVDVDRARSLWLQVRWTLGRLARARAPRGLQYSETFLQALWRTADPPSRERLA